MAELAEYRRRLVEKHVKEVMVNFGYLQILVLISRGRRRLARVLEKSDLLKKRERDITHERYTQRALTFSFALPACFCTVFAINAPLLSAMMFP